MSFLLGFFDKLAECETDDALKQMDKYYGPLYHWSLVFPHFRRSHLPITLPYMAIVSFVVAGHFFLEIIAVWKEHSDNELTSIILHHEMVLTFAISMLINFNYLRKPMSRIHVTMKESLGKYQGFNVYEEEEVKRIRKELNRQKHLYLLIPCVGIVLSGGATTIPYVLHYEETRVTPTGINKNLLFPTYYPFPTDHGVGHVVAMALQMALVSFVVMALLCSLLALMNLVEKLRLEYRVGCHVIDTLISRSTELYKQKYSSTLDTIDNPNYQSCISVRLRELILHHNLIIRFSDDVRDVARWSMAVNFSVGTCAISLSLVSILWALKEENYENLVIFALMLMCEVTNVFLGCTLGEATSSDSKDFHDRLYLIKWYYLNKPNRKTLLNLQVGSLKPCEVKAGGFMVANHETFSTVMNFSYSFFNLMSQSDLMG